MKFLSVIAEQFSRPWAIITFALLSIGYAVAGGPMLGFNVVLSVMSITTTQLVLLVNSNRDKAMHAKLDELVRAIPNADNMLIGIEAKVVTKNV